VGEQDSQSAADAKATVRSNAIEGLRLECQKVLGNEFLSTFLLFHDKAKP
jgi:hypothetical protein